jgi:hypothetical protein
MFMLVGQLHWNSSGRYRPKGSKSRLSAAPRFVLNYQGKQNDVQTGRLSLVR